MRYSSISHISHQNIRRASEVTPNPASDLWRCLASRLYAQGRVQGQSKHLWYLPQHSPTASLKVPSPEVGPTYLNNPMHFFSFWTLANPSSFPTALRVIPTWKAASFQLSPPSCRFLWGLALGEAVKSQSPFILPTSLMVSQSYTTLPWKDSRRRFIRIFWWSMPVLHCPHNWKTSPRVMLNFQGNACFFFNPIPNNCRDRLNL